MLITVLIIWSFWIACNIVVNNDMEGVYTLDNFGLARNCSLTAIFDAKFRIMYMNAGLQNEQVKFSSTSSAGLHRRVLHKVCMSARQHVVIGWVSYWTIELCHHEMKTMCRSICDIHYMHSKLYLTSILYAGWTD